MSRSPAPAGAPPSGSHRTHPAASPAPLPDPGHTTASRALIAVAGAAYLAIALFFHPVGDYYTESDFYGGYAEGARLVQQGRLDPARYPVVGPFYDVALAVAGWVVPDLFTAAKLISVLSAVGTLAAWALLLERRAGAGIAFWTVAFLAVNPVFLRYACSASTDMLATFLVSAGALGVITGRSRRALAAAGALAALAFLTRYNTIALVPAGLLIAGRRRDGRLRAAATFLLAFAIIATPWIVHAARSGHPPGESLFRNFGFYATAGATRNVQDAIVDPGAAPDSVDLGEALRGNPGGVARWVLIGIPDHLSRDAIELIGWPALALVLAGLAIALRGGLWRALIPVAVFGLAIFASLLPAFYSDRYSMPLAPVYLSLAGTAVARLVPGRGRGGLRWGLALVLLAWATAGAVVAQRRVLARAPVETLAAGRALARVAAPDDRLMSRKGHVGYHARLVTVDFPRFRTLAGVAGHAHRRQARFLYYSWYEAMLRPEHAYLLDTTSVVPGLVPIFASDRPPSVVYRIGPGFGREPEWMADAFQLSVRNARVLVGLQPDSAAWRHRTVLAVDALTRGRPEEALELARRATRSAPADTLGWVVQGEGLALLGRHREAIAAYRAALALDPRDLAAGLGAGRSHLALGDRAGAASAWRPLIGRIEDRETRAQMDEVFAAIGDSAARRALRATASTH